MSSRLPHGLWLLSLILVVGCQSTGRMARGPQAAPAQAKNQPPPAAQGGMPQGVAQATPAANRPPAEYPTPPVPPAPTAPPKQDKDLVIRATSPSAGEPGFPASDAHHPAAPAASANPVAKTPSELERIRALYDQAVAKDGQIQDYVCRFRRREVVRGKALPEDLLLFRHLKEPSSVYFKWLPGTPSDGREIIYVPGKYKNQIQVRTGKGDLLNGMRTEIDPRSERATANCRRTIDEAGLPQMLQRFGVVLAGQEQGKSASTLQHVGPQQRPEGRAAMECVGQRVMPGQEKQLPQGGTRYWFFCTDPQAPEHGLPTLIITLDESRREVEYYSFDQFKLNAGLRQQDFDPDSLWGKR